MGWWMWETALMTLLRHTHTWLPFVRLRSAGLGHGLPLRNARDNQGDDGMVEGRVG